MAVYKVVGPCAYVQDGKAVQHNHPGKVVRLDEAVAEELGNKVELVEDDPDDPTSDPDYGEDDGDIA